MLSRPAAAILYVGNFLSTSGYNQTFIEALADRIGRAGWNVVRTSHCKNRFLRLANIATTCWFRRNDYQIAHIAVFSGSAFIWAEVAAQIVKAAGRPFVLSLHGGNLPTFARRWPRRVRRLLSSAKAVITPSGYLFEEMKPYRDEMIVFPNPLDLRNYPHELRQKPAPRLLWLRAFHAIYNPSLAAKVVSLLAKDYPDLELMMVGPDKGDGSLQATENVADELGVTKRLVVTGGISKKAVPVTMQQADIFLNTTNVDNTPISVIEAMACGLCIVSTDVGGIPYLLEHEHSALLVPANDAQAMAAAVRRILTEPGLAARLSRNARKAAEQFDWSLILPKWESLMLAVATDFGPKSKLVRASEQTV